MEPTYLGIQVIVVFATMMSRFSYHVYILHKTTNGCWEREIYVQVDIALMMTWGIGHIVENKNLFATPPFSFRKLLPYAVVEPTSSSNRNSQMVSETWLKCIGWERFWEYPSWETFLPGSIKITFKVMKKLFHPWKTSFPFSVWYSFFKP